MDRNAGETCFVPVNRWVDGKRLAAIIERSRVRLIDWPVKGVTKYKEWSLRHPGRVQECGEWLFGGIVSVPYETPTTTFLWNEPPVTFPEGEEEDLAVRMKGRLVSEVKTTRNYPWPNVLKDLKAARNPYSFALLKDWLPGDNIPSVVRTRVYVSDIAPTGFFLRTDTPKPTEINGTFVGSPISLPPCLHTTVVLQPEYTAGATIVDLMPSKRGARINTSKLEHEPTNHTGWKTHIFDIDVQEDDGLFFRTVSKVYAPLMPKTLLS
jgi:hypothetical protein